MPARSFLLRTLVLGLLIPACSSGSIGSPGEEADLTKQAACGKLGVAACEAASDRCSTSSVSPKCEPGTLCSHIARFVCIDKAPAACATLGVAACEAAPDHCSTSSSLRSASPERSAVTLRDSCASTRSPEALAAVRLSVVHAATLARHAVAVGVAVDPPGHAKAPRVWRASGRVRLDAVKGRTRSKRSRRWRSPRRRFVEEERSDDGRPHRRPIAG